MPLHRSEEIIKKIESDGMNRSQINDIMSAADDLIRSHGFSLPPFAYWSVDEFQARKDEAKPIVDMPLLAGHFL